jgi:tetratricopeptide (TPR) repeat protein
MLVTPAKVMTDSDYIEKIDMAWPRSIHASATEAVRLVEEGLSAFPKCAKLWCMKGDLIQLSDGPPYELADALRCYKKAAELAPDSPEAFESLGFFFDAIESDMSRAEIAFRKAVELGGGPHTYAGLARVLSGQGHNTEELLAMLDACPHAQSPPVQEMRSELVKGAWKPVSKK